MYRSPTAPQASPMSAYHASCSGLVKPNWACAPKIGLKPTADPKIE